MPAENRSFLRLIPWKVSYLGRALRLVCGRRVDDPLLVVERLGPLWGEGSSISVSSKVVLSLLADWSCRRASLWLLALASVDRQLLLLLLNRLLSNLLLDLLLLLDWLKVGILVSVVLLLLLLLLHVGPLRPSLV